VPLVAEAPPAPLLIDPPLPVALVVALLPAWPVDPVLGFPPPPVRLVPLSSPPHAVADARTRLHAKSTLGRNPKFMIILRG
jgi:hypothetical protein